MPLPSAETTPPVTKTYFVAASLTAVSRARRASRRTGVRSIKAPSERRSPTSVRPASAAIALQRCLSVRTLTDLKPSTAPSVFEPESPSIVISRRS